MLTIYEQVPVLMVSWNITVRTVKKACIGELQLKDLETKGRLRRYQWQKIAQSLNPKQGPAALLACCYVTFKYTSILGSQEFKEYMDGRAW